MYKKNLIQYKLYNIMGGHLTFYSENNYYCIFKKAVTSEQRTDKSCIVIFLNLIKINLYLRSEIFLFKNIT